MKTYTLQPTKDEHLYRVVDRQGNWNHYAYVENPPKKGEVNWDNAGEMIFLRGITSVLDRGYPKGRGFEEYLVRTTAEERDRLLSGAGDRGDKVHRYLDLALTASGSPDFGTTFSRTLAIYSKKKKEEVALEDDEWGCILAFAAFWKKHDPVLYISEFPAYSLADEVAGTGDAIWKLTKECDDKRCACHGVIGKIGLPDWKTSSGIRASFSAQTGVYAKCPNVQEFIPKGATIEYTAILRLGTAHKNGGYEFRTYGVEEGYDRFKAALTIDNYEYTPFDPKIEVQDVPDTIDLVVKRPEDDVDLNDPNIERPMTPGEAEIAAGLDEHFADTGKKVGPEDQAPLFEMPVKITKRKSKAKKSPKKAK